MAVTISRQLNLDLAVEIQDLVRVNINRAASPIEAVFRIRALRELSERLGTEALLKLAAEAEP